MKLTDYITVQLEKSGVDRVFGYQGGNIAHFIDSLAKSEKIRFVTTYNEQGAAFAACGHAYAAGGIGVAVASSGPGAINLVQGIANAYYDSIPCIFITGNVAQRTMKGDRLVRQNAFQENDIIAMVKSVTKYAVTVKDPEKIGYHLEKAIFLAQHGRPGPVLLDLPHDVQKSEIIPEALSGYTPQCDMTFSDKESSVKKAVDCFCTAARPLVVVGGGATSQKARLQIQHLLEQGKIPVVATLRGLDVVPHDTATFIGFAGAYGNRYANMALHYCDTVLVLGARMDERFVSEQDRPLMSGKTLIHVDVDEAELGHTCKETLSIHETVEEFLDRFLPEVNEKFVRNRWNELLLNWKERYSSTECGKASYLNDIVRLLTMEAGPDTLFYADVGLNQMCVAQAAYLRNEQRLFMSAGHGAMGFALPAAIGGAFARKAENIVCFVGDGALHMNIQELLMLSHHMLPVHIVLFNNKSLGMIRDYQKKAFNSRFAGTADDFHEIDYEAIAKAYRLDYLRIDDQKELIQACKMLTQKSPSLIDIRLPEDINAFPEVSMSFLQQNPPLEPQQLQLIEEEVHACQNIIFW